MKTMSKYIKICLSPAAYLGIFLFLLSFPSVTFGGTLDDMARDAAIDAAANSSTNTAAGIGAAYLQGGKPRLTPDQSSAMHHLDKARNTMSPEAYMQLRNQIMNKNDPAAIAQANQIYSQFQQNNAKPPATVEPTPPVEPAAATQPAPPVATSQHGDIPGSPGYEERIQHLQDIINDRIRIKDDLEVRLGIRQGDRDASDQNMSPETRAILEHDLQGQKDSITDFTKDIEHIRETEKPPMDQGPTADSGHSDSSGGGGGATAQGNSSCTAPCSSHS